MLCVQANIKEGFSRQRKNNLKKQKNRNSSIGGERGCNYITMIMWSKNSDVDSSLAWKLMCWINTEDFLSEVELARFEYILTTNLFQEQIGNFRETSNLLNFVRPELLNFINKRNETRFSLYRLI